MPVYPKISESEWEVMNIIWEKAPLGAAEVIMALTDKEWSSRTIKTLLSRLVKKGALSFVKEKNRYIYEPVFKKEEFIKKEGESFLSKIKEKLSFPVLLNFVKESDLSREEIETLRKILDKRSEDSNDN